MSRYQINSLRPTAIVVHGLHKSGSMFLYQLFQRLARSRRIAYFSANHAEPNDDQVTATIDRDFCLCPVRTFANQPMGLGDHYRVRRIFQVRDPRDIIVSQFFSYGWRHTNQGFQPGQQYVRKLIQGMSIDEYALHIQGVVQPLKQQFAELIHRQPYELRNVVRYEEMVSQFPSWLEKVISVFDFRVPAAVKARFAFRYRNEFRPDSSPNSHKRNVTPGDHIRKLRPETIARLNELFQPELLALGYQANPSIRAAA